MFNSIEDCRKYITCSQDYKFLTDSNIWGKLSFLAITGSYLYGTNTADSDIDIRGIATNTPRNILLGKDFKTFSDDKTDTTIFSFNRIVSMLANCNPQTLELLNIPYENVLVTTPTYLLLLNNTNLFLTQKAIGSFKSYAFNQGKELEKQLKKISELKNKPEYQDELKLWIKRANKSMLHIVRLYLMGTDILKGNGVIVRRTKEHDLLMSIRCGAMLDLASCKPNESFINLRNKLVNDFDYAAKNTSLPVGFDAYKIEELVIAANKMELGVRGVTI